MSFANRIPAYQARVEQALDHWLPPAAQAPARLHEAMRYAVLGGGKRIRPLLIYATGELLGVPATELDGPAAAVEMVHAYSLVHDDLPAMDNDDLRRGRPTCHIAFDDATAILAGDALQVLAFEVLTRDPAMTPDPAARLQMLALLAAASGSIGMAGGQALDLAAPNLTTMGQRLGQAELEQMHGAKTGALLGACVQLAACAATELAAEARAALSRYGAAVGLAFQIQDDILDVEGETGRLGKTSGADAARQKPTYPSVMGLAAAKARAQALHQDACAALVGFGTAAEPLRWLSEHIVTRDS